MLFEQVRQQLNRLESVHLGLECSDNVGSTYLLDTDKASQLGEEYTRHLSSLQTKGGLAAGQLRCMDNTAALMAPFRVQAQDGSYAGKDDPEHNPIPVKAQYAETPLSVPPEPPPGQNSDRLWIKDDETNALKNVQRYLGAAYIMIAEPIGMTVWTILAPVVGEHSYHRDSHSSSSDSDARNEASEEYMEAKSVELQSLGTDSKDSGNNIRAHPRRNEEELKKMEWEVTDAVGNPKSREGCKVASNLEDEGTSLPDETGVEEQTKPLTRNTPGNTHNQNFVPPGHEHAA